MVGRLGWKIRCRQRKVKQFPISNFQFPVVQAKYVARECFSEEHKQIFSQKVNIPSEI